MMNKKLFIFLFLFKIILKILFDFLIFNIQIIIIRWPLAQLRMIFWELVKQIIAI